MAGDSPSWLDRSRERRPGPPCRCERSSAAPRTRSSPRSARREKVADALREAADVAREAMVPLPREARQGLAPLGQVPLGRARRLGACPGPAPVVEERRLHHDAAVPGLAHREGQVAIVAMKETVTLVEPADRFEQRAPEEQAHAVHGSNPGDRRTEIAAPLEA